MRFKGRRFIRLDDSELLLIKASLEVFETLSDDVKTTMISEIDDELSKRKTMRHELEDMFACRL